MNSRLSLSVCIEKVFLIILKKGATMIRPVLLIFFFASIAHAQLRLDANIEFTTMRNEPSSKINTNFRGDDPFNPVKAKLFAGYRINPTFGLEAEILFDNKAFKFGKPSAKAPVRPDGYFLSIRRPADFPINFWIGKIPTPVGKFSPRSYSHLNPLIGYPLAYQYKVPYNVFTLSSETSNLSLRDRNLGAGTSIYEACWITGLSAFGNLDGTEYMVAIGRGTLTNPEARENKGFQIAGRVGRSFNNWLTAGVSGGIAPYLQHSTGLPSGTSIRDPKHLILGADASARFNNLNLIFEAFYNSWDTPQYQSEKNIHAFTWYLEGQYFILSNLYAAARLNQVRFNDITNPTTLQETPWGYDITRTEAALGFSPISELLIKAVVQHNSFDSPTIQNITIYALQVAFHFEHLQKLLGLDPGEKPSSE